jgi:hypothetical protein
MRHRPRALLALGLPLLAVGCSDWFGPKMCTMDIHPAIEVTVRDAASGAWIAGQATGWAIDGSYRDSLRFGRGFSENGAMVWTALRGADERPGTYRVEITAPGYAPWLRDDVRVRDGECHVSSVGLDARLQPLPAAR